MASFWKNIARHQNARPQDFSVLNSSAKCEGVERIRTEIPNGGNSPAGQHLLHVGRQLVRGSGSRVLPSRFEVHMAVPESSDNKFSAAIDCVRSGWQREFHGARVDGR